jgi:hypothetical protein
MTAFLAAPRRLISLNPFSKACNNARPLELIVMLFASLTKEQDRVDEQKGDLIERVASRLTRTIEVQDIFTVRWQLA